MVLFFVTIFEQISLWIKSRNFEYKMTLALCKSQSRHTYALDQATVHALVHLQDQMTQDKLVWVKSLHWTIVNSHIVLLYLQTTCSVTHTNMHTYQAQNTLWWHNSTPCSIVAQKCPCFEDRIILPPIQLACGLFSSGRENKVALWLPCTLRSHMESTGSGDPVEMIAPHCNFHFLKCLR